MSNARTLRHLLAAGLLLAPALAVPVVIGTPATASARPDKGTNAGDAHRQDQAGVGLHGTASRTWV